MRLSSGKGKNVCSKALGAGKEKIFAGLMRVAVGRLCVQGRWLELAKLDAGCDKPFLPLGTVCLFADENGYTIQNKSERVCDEFGGCAIDLRSFIERNVQLIL